MLRLPDWLGRRIDAIKSSSTINKGPLLWVRSNRFASWSILAVVSIFVAAWLTPNADTLTSFEGRTESFSYWPGNRDGFYLEFDQAWVERAKLRDGSNSQFEGRCSLNFVVAGDPKKLQIERLHSDLQTLVISTELGSKVSLSSENIPDEEIVIGPLFVHLRSSATAGQPCAQRGTVRLPVEGLIQIGGENADESGKLLGGDLTIFGRAKPGMLSILAGGEGSSEDTIIYSAGALELPAGSRVGNVVENEMQDDQSNQWIGFIEADLGSTEPGFSVSLQTAANEVRVWNQAADSSVPDKISMGWTARLAGDPYFQWLIGILAASFAVIGIIAQRIPVED